MRAECAAHALSRRERHGVWGGFTSRERMRLLELGWEDLADERRTRVNIAGLERQAGHPFGALIAGPSTAGTGPSALGCPCRGLQYQRWHPPTKEIGTADGR